MAARKANAQYFDGISARSHEIIVSFEPYALTFELAGEFQRLRPAMIKNVEYEKAYVRIGLVGGAALIFTGEEIAANLKSSGFGKGELSLTTGGRHLAVWAMALVLIAMITLAAWKPAMDWVADRAAIAIPDAVMVKLGDEVMQSVVEEWGIVQGDRVRAALAGITTDLNKRHPELPYKIRIHILDHFKQVNAFALPNGVIVLSRPILDMVDDRETLIALIGHEAGHLTNRHGTRRIVRMVLLPVIAGLFFGDASGLGTILAENSSVLFNLAHGREEELQADKAGLELLVDLEMNPDGARRLLHSLMDETGDHGWLEYITTHPAGTRRVNRIEAELGKVPLKKKYKKGPISDEDWRILKTLAEKKRGL